MSYKLAADFSLPREAVTKTIAILAIRGAGKLLFPEGLE